jgi:tartrate dehydratase beta subunit/fumarate hydratase class I family protein
MRIESAEGTAYSEFGPEAIYGRRVRDFPCFVINDIHKAEVTR